MSNEKHLVKKTPKSAQCMVSFQCSILQSLPAAPYLVTKRQMLHVTPTGQYRDNKEVNHCYSLN